MDFVRGKKIPLRYVEQSKIVSQNFTYQKKNYTDVNMRKFGFIEAYIRAVFKGKFNISKNLVLHI